MIRRTRYLSSFIVLVLGIIFLISGCKGDGKNDESTMITKSMNEPRKSESELKKDILQNGSVEAYDELSTAYLDHAEGEFFVWALIMANKYDYARAYFDVFLSLQELSYSDSDNFSMEHLDVKTREVAMDYLKKSAEKGEPQAKDILGTYYIEGRYVQQNIELGKKMKDEYNAFINGSVK